MVDRQLFWIGWSFGLTYMFLNFPVTLMLKGDFPTGWFKTLLWHSSTFMNIPGSTQGRICCLLAEEEESTNKDIFKRNIWTLAMCFIYFTYNVYFARKIKKYLFGQCPNTRLSCIGKYPRNAISYKESISPVH